MKHNRVPRFTHTFVIYEADALARAVSRPPLRRRAPVEPRRDERGPPRRLLVPDAGHRPGRGDRATPGSGQSISSLAPMVRSISPTGTIARSTTTATTRGRSTRSIGRIYRLGPKSSTSPARPVDLASLSTPALVKRSGRLQLLDATDGAPADRRSQGPLDRARA